MVISGKVTDYVLIAMEWNRDHNCMHCSDPYEQEYVLIALEWNCDHNCRHIDHCCDPYGQENVLIALELNQ